MEEKDKKTEGTPPTGENKEEGMYKEGKWDIVDELKASEGAIRKIVLIKMLDELKVMAHQVFEYKEKCHILLAEIGVPEADAKRVIDFINNLSSVQLSDADKEEIRKWAKKEVQMERQSVTKRLEEKVTIDPILRLFNGTPCGMGGASGMVYGGRDDSLGQLGNASDIVLCSADNDKDTLTIKM